MPRGLLLFGFTLAVHVLFSQTVGLTKPYQAPIDGYVLFSPMTNKTSYLIDRCGNKVNQWTSTYTPGLAAYLEEDGTLYRSGKVGNTEFTAGGVGGVIERFDWSGNLLWQFNFSSSEFCQHHDFEVLPNGNLLLISWEKKSANEAIESGRNPALTGNSVWSEMVLEIKPNGITGGDIVWEWHAWDHLVQNFDNSKLNFAPVDAHPELIDANYKALANTEDWLHFNSIDYNSDLDQIMLSSHSFSEVWIIDHSTTTVQAKTHTGGNSAMGGDLLYRWGNPFAYGKGTPGIRKFWGQHDAEWIPNGLPNAGSIMVFNNGNGRSGGNYSTIEVFTPPVNGFNYQSALPYLPVNSDMVFNSGNSLNFYAQNISGSQQLPSGNVLVCDGPAGRFFELNTAQELVWEYVNPVNNAGPMTQGTNPSQNLVFHCEFYPSDYPAFTSNNLENLGIIENENTLSDNCNLSAGVGDVENLRGYLIVPNPAKNQIRIMGGNGPLTMFSIGIYSLMGKLIYFDSEVSPDQFVDISGINSGMYIINISGDNFSKVLKLSVL